MNLREGFLSKFLTAVGLKRREPGEPQNKVSPSDGHRGMAFGRVGKGKENVSEENRKKWERLQDREAADFVYNGSILYVHSSNVAAAQYTIESNQLILSFLNGSVYVYGDVSEDEAISFAQSMSKGSWVWQNLRVLGSKTAHKKPFHKIS